MIDPAIIRLLKAHVPDFGVRPFVCDGDPMRTAVFSVGHNPRNRNVEFWKYWSNSSGFSKREFERDYLALKGAFRGTRLRLNRLSLGLKASNLHILETNLYWKPTDWLKDLDEKDIEPFLELLSLIRPRYIIAHGKHACKHIDSALKRSGIEAHVERAGHFMNLKYSVLDSIADRILQEASMANRVAGGVNSPGPHTTGHTGP